MRLIGTLMSLMWGSWVNCDLIRLYVGLKKNQMVQTNNNDNNIIIMGCGCFQNDCIFRIGAVQVRHTGMNKLCDGKRLFGSPGFGCTSIYSVDPHAINMYTTHVAHFIYNLNSHLSLFTQEIYIQKLTLLL